MEKPTSTIYYYMPAQAEIIRLTIVRECQLGKALYLIDDKAFPYEHFLCPYNSHVTFLRYYGGQDFPIISEVNPVKMNENSIV
ncbi:MAG: hypothetical protein LBC04_00320 [Holosporaceae bacterium]|nr:hypothetical protein [Holosporaceae bacterium]